MSDIFTVDEIAHAWTLISQVNCDGSFVRFYQHPLYERVIRYLWFNESTKSWDAVKSKRSFPRYKDAYEHCLTVNHLRDKNPTTIFSNVEENNAEETQDKTIP